MKFTSEEIEKANELARLRFFDKVKIRPAIGSYLTGRKLCAGCVALDEPIFLIVSLDPEQEKLLWLPTWEEALEMTRELKLSFSLITDFLHRRRFADGREREGLYQLLIERAR